MAEPPHMPVPAEIKLDNFQFKPSALPIKYPPPKQVSNVKIMTVKDIFPTCSMVVMFRESPSNIMANFNIFFEVNFKPSENRVVLCK